MSGVPYVHKEYYMYNDGLYHHTMARTVENSGFRLSRRNQQGELDANGTMEMSACGKMNRYLVDECFPVDSEKICEECERVKLMWELGR